MVIGKLGTKNSDLIIAVLCGAVVALITGFIIKAGIVIFGVIAGVVAARLVSPFLSKETQ